VTGNLSFLECHWAAIAADMKTVTALVGAR
jgi:hypothetical protein